MISKKRILKALDQQITNKYCVIVDLELEDKEHYQLSIQQLKEDIVELKKIKDRLVNLLL